MHQQNPIKIPIIRYHSETSSDQSCVFRTVEETVVVFRAVTYIGDWGM